VGSSNLSGRTRFFSRIAFRPRNASQHVEVGGRPQHVASRGFSNLRGRALPRFLTAFQRLPPRTEQFSPWRSSLHSSILSSVKKTILLNNLQPHTALGSAVALYPRRPKA